MITLRKYIKSDAKEIVGWTSNENDFRMWCADRFRDYPLTADKFDEIYESGQLSGYIAEDDGKTVGHLFIQKLENQTYKFGLIIVDPSKRGMGYGNKMLQAALSFAQASLGASRVILSAFDTNPAAYNCYKRLGFNETGKITEYTFFNKKHNYIELEYLI